MIGHLIVLAIAAPFQFALAGWSRKYDVLEAGEAAFWCVVIFLLFELVYLGLMS
ncbi:hypothetical protein V6C03_05340 [Methyloligella sp. 2.7D]|uniref:hypothetical protein n=1 Tax=unclassified Methyloligella TaxID=2625955 RepID=UPI00157D517F|nr:hypothetical protein [Methyloligella sp. GL2]QKP75991.1 hypothetical protein HT051_00085 [Methyloligella sp. GL2]